MSIRPESLIGKKYIPHDNSYCLRLSMDRYHQDGTSWVYLSGTQVGDEPKETTIISEPYEQLIKNDYKDQGRMQRFVNVEYQGHHYRLLYREDWVQWSTPKPQLKVYIGTKVVKAIPMTNKQYRELQRLLPVLIEEGGYLVEYEDGYTSWSPKATFERAYREVTDKEIVLLDVLKK